MPVPSRLDPSLWYQIVTNEARASNDECSKAKGYFRIHKLPNTWTMRPLPRRVRCGLHLCLSAVASITGTY